MNHIYNRLSHRILAGCMILMVMAGCKKAIVSSDPGTANEFVVKLPSESTSLMRGVENGDSIKAQIHIPGQTEPYDTAAYSYVWTSLQNRDTLSKRHFLTIKDFEKQAPTLISCLLTVTEKKTGIQKMATTNVFVTTATREGWVLLGDRSGTAQLGLLSYTAQGYKKFTDLSSELNINIPLTGKPISINSIGSDLPYGLSLYQWMGITTDQQITILNSMNFGVDQKISAYLNQLMPPSQAAPVKFIQSGGSAFVGTRGSDVYHFSFFMMSYFGFLSNKKLNTYPPGVPGSPSFIASANHTFAGTTMNSEQNRILYDEDSCEFVRAQIQGNAFVNGIFPLQLPFSKKGFQLKAIHSKLGGIESVNQEDIYAFLYNPTTKEGYMLEFLSNAVLKKVSAIQPNDAIDIAASPFIEIDYNTGYLIYTKGNEVKAYDYKIGQTLSLLNFGQESISLLKMERYVPGSSRAVGRMAVYDQLYRRLVVCTYDPSNPDNTGIFRLYQIPLGHQAPLKEVEETGFPKIVDVTFNPIP